MTTQIDDDDSPMEIDAPNDASAYDDQTTRSADLLLDQAIGFSANNQRELPVNLRQRDLLEESTSDQSIDDDERGMHESNTYIYHASYSSDGPKMRFPTFRSEFEENQWSETHHRTKRFFVRKQPRDGSQTRDVKEDDVKLHELNRQFGNVNVNSEESFYYHATSWESAIKKLEEGPRMSEGPSDMAYYGAFYLNPDYHDCHDWFYTKDSSFQGEHAMLIYKFRPETLSKKGKEVRQIKKWQSLAGERSQPSGKFEDDWTYTYQNSDPKHIHKSGDNARIRKRWDEQSAMQLIIYSEKMCRKIHDCLMGCIYYENCAASVNQLDISSQIFEDHQLDLEINFSASCRIQSQSNHHESKFYRNKRRK